MKERNRRDFLKSTIAAVLAGAGTSATLDRALAADATGNKKSDKRRSHLTIAGNPIVPGRGLCDPQVRIFNKRVYLYATHDASPENKGFHMDNWWVWSTDDLVHWEEVSVLMPEETFIRRPFTQCWATDAGTRNGSFFFYFSAGPEQIGVVVGDTPAGPWRDPLGKPLIPKGLTPTEERDPGILMDDDGSSYIIFGTWNYYIARLNDDMISLAESPRLVVLNHKAGPYGEGKTDDKPFLHKRAGKYYLSWGCFYAMADNPYGPYTYKGSIITPETTSPEFLIPKLLMDRHGSFFEFHGQWYFACNDHSQLGSSPFFRNSILSYVHYRNNGEIAPIRIDRTGVGQYDASAGRIEAEDYFKIAGGTVCEHAGSGFEVRGLADRSFLIYPHVGNVPLHSKLIVRLSNYSASRGRLEVHIDGPDGPLIGEAVMPSTGGWDRYQDVEIPLKTARQELNLALVFRGASGELARLDSWRIVDLFDK